MAIAPVFARGAFPPFRARLAGTGVALVFAHGVVLVLCAAHWDGRCTGFANGVPAFWG